MLREDGSNVQDVLAAWFEPTDEPSAALGVQVRMTEGRLEVTDEPSGRTLRVADLRLDLDKPLAAEQPLTSILEGKLQSGGESGGEGRNPAGANPPRENPTQVAAKPSLEAGAVRAEVTWKFPADAATEGLGRGEVKLALNAVTLAAVQPLLDRLAPGVQLGGRVSSDVTLGFQGGPARPATEVSGWINAGGLVLVAPAWLGEDHFGTETLRLSGRVTLVDGRLRASEAGLESDVARLKLTGSASLAQLAEKSWLTWLAESLQSDDYQLEGEIDLAQLVALLPHTLRVREGIEITSGRVVFQSSGLVSDGHRTWLASVHTAELAGTANGRPVAWEDPLEISLAAHQSDQGPVVDKLVCQAEFLKVQAAGNWREATATVEGSLDKLTAELNQFFDLGSLKMAGTFGGKLTCLHPQEDRIQVVGVWGVDGLLLSLPGGGTLSEPRVDVQLSAVGVGDDRGLRSVAQIEFNLVTESGTAEIQLVRPVDTVSWNTSWPLAARLSGDVDDWLNRLRPWLPTDGWDISGQTQMAGEVWVSPEKIVVKQATVDVTQLHAHGPGLYIDEPHVRLEATCTWDQTTRQLTAPSATLVTGDAATPAGDTIAFQLQAQEIAVQLAEPGPPKVAGTVAFRGTLEQVMQWFTHPQSPPAQQLAGRISGQAQLEYAGEQTRGQWSASIDNLVYATLQAVPAAREARQPGSVAPASATARWEPVWREQQVTVEGQADYHFASDALKLDRLDVVSEMLRLTAAGRIDELGGRRKADLKGEVEYDLNNVTAKLVSWLGPQIALTGRQQRSFTVQGPLVFSHSVAANGAGRTDAARLTSRESPADGFAWPRDLTGAAGFGWTTADLYGLQAGEGNFDAQLADGVVTAPLDLTLSGGRIRLVPRVAVGQSPMTLLIDPGRAVENVQITDQMSGTWLKYVAPFFAEATRIDGRFSLDLQHARVPLAEPATSDVAGTLHIHSARLRPGPLFDQFVFLAQQIQSLIELRPAPQPGTLPQSGLVEVEPQAVPFQMVQGRVYHRDLTLNVRGVRIRMSGSVGLDQSLDLVAEIPILEEWGRRQGVLSSLGGKSLKIPVRGRLGQPDMDDRALRQVARGVAESAAGRLIERGLDRAFEEVFRPGGAGTP